MDITFIFEFVITCVSLFFTACLIPYLVNKFGITKVTNAYEIIKILVNSVEQIYQKTNATGAGKAKKNEVIEKLKNEYNITLDEKVVSDLIESAVHEMNNAINK